jgi:hypothetical protein
MSVLLFNTIIIKEEEECSGKKKKKMMCSACVQQTNQTHLLWACIKVLWELQIRRLAVDDRVVCIIIEPRSITNHLHTEYNDLLFIMHIVHSP